MAAAGASRPLNVLVLCTGNSARSILSEALLRHHGRGRVVAHSAGSRPAGRVNPLALRVLEEHGIDTAGLRSKSWDEFALPGQPPMDIVITVCDSAAGETCPLWPGTPVRVHWGLPDPAAATGSEAQQLAAFRYTYDQVEHRVRRLVALPEPLPDRTELAAQLLRIHAGLP